MSTSSSSDDENDENIREAVDPVFFSNDLFQPSKKTKEVKEEPHKLPPSLRCQNQPTSTFNPLEIKVTQEFRAHVSKHLRRILDELIDDTQELPINKKKIPNTKADNGSIKLLKSSKSYIKETYSELDVPLKKKHIKKKRRKIDNESSSDDEARAREVAVSADWILSGKATEGWAPNTRGEVEIITMKSCK